MSRLRDDRSKFAQRVENYRNEDYDRDDSYAVDIMEDMLAAIRVLEVDHARLAQIAQDMHKADDGACSLYAGAIRGSCETCGRSIEQHREKKWASVIEAAIGAKP